MSGDGAGDAAGGSAHTSPTSIAALKVTVFKNEALGFVELETSGGHPGISALTCVTRISRKSRRERDFSACARILQTRSNP